MKNKGAKQKVKRKGAASAFGCDLTEYLESSGQDGWPSPSRRSVLAHLLRFLSFRGPQEIGLPGQCLPLPYQIPKFQELKTIQPLPFQLAGTRNF
ncbi:Rho GTPase-activating protein 31 [Fukomys damarensis]|uniref:Rho GTPase-activating protein 31 n=1 Tax=Fukomys damarensis TaxID=885580 RepID=A0A091DF46_FUKDA|nr:Rho GTPase-activating protein 31 [Fukomys damarensis]